MSLILLRNYLRTIVDNARDRPPIFSPMLTCIYITHRCNLRCVYCDDGSGRSFPEDKKSELDTAQMIEVLRIVRKEYDVLSITGGEPTMRDDIIEILAATKELKFRQVLMNTNAILAREKSEMFDYLDTVMVSLDSLNEKLSDRLWRAPDGTTKIVKENIEWLMELRKEKGFNLGINTVIIPENIPDVYEIMKYCDKNRVTFAPGPAIDRFYPMEGLRDNPDYIRLMNHVIDMKRKGHKILGTEQCFSHERDFAKFKCIPMTVSRIQPDGNLLFPCNRLRQLGGNVLETGSIKESIRIGYEKHGYPPECDNRCHLMCYVDISLIVTNPLLCVLDGIYRTRCMFRNAFKK